MNCLVGEALRTDDIPRIGFCRWPWLQGIFNININVACRFRHSMLYYLSGPCPLQKMGIEPMQSIQSSDEAHAIETGCSRPLLVIIIK